MVLLTIFYEVDMKNIKIISSIIIVILLLMYIFTFLVSPVKDIALTENAKQPAAQLPASKIRYNKNNNKLSFEIDPSEGDIERLIYASIKNNMKVEGLEVNITDNNFNVYISTYLLGFIKTQYILQLYPYVKDNKLAFKLVRVNAGRIPVFKAYALNKMSTLNLKNIIVDDEGITIKNDAVKPFMVSDVHLENGRIKLYMNIQFKLFQDLKELLEYKIPEDIKSFIRNLISNFILK